jgi:hypothetical protein
MAIQATKRWTLAIVLWGVAYLALGLGAVVAGPDRSGVLGVGLAGGLLWVVALVSEEMRSRGAPKGAANGIVVFYLVVAGCLEGLAARSAFAQGARDQVFWFAMALAFAAAGVITTTRRDPSDGALVSQLFFHGLMLFPSLANVAGIWLHQGAAPPRVEPLARSFIIIAGVAVPVLFLTLVALLTYDLQRPRADRGSAWLALVAAESAYVVALFRWAQNGV